MAGAARSGRLGGVRVRADAVEGEHVEAVLDQFRTETWAMKGGKQ